MNNTDLMIAVKGNLGKRLTNYGLKGRSLELASKAIDAAEKKNPGDDESLASSGSEKSDKAQ